MFELLVKNATLPDGRTSIDIGCSKGKIVALENGISAEAKDTIDAKGCLLYTSPSPRDKRQSRMPSSA